MTYLFALLLLAALIVIGVCNYRQTIKTARRLVNHCTEER